MDFFQIFFSKLIIFVNDNWFHLVLEDLDFIELWALTFVSIVFLFMFIFCAVLLWSFFKWMLNSIYEVLSL